MQPSARKYRRSTSAIRRTLVCMPDLPDLHDGAVHLSGCYSQGLTRPSPQSRPSQNTPKPRSFPACRWRHLCQRKAVHLGKGLCKLCPWVSGDPSAARGVEGAQRGCCCAVFSASMPASVMPLMPCKDSSSRSGQPSASASTAASVSWTHHVRLTCWSGAPLCHCCDAPHLHAHAGTVTHCPCRCTKAPTLPMHKGSESL